MAQSSIPLTSLTEAQRAQAVTRFTIIRPALEDGITQAQVARTHNIPAPTVRRWMKHYRDKGLAGLADAATRSDKGKSRRLPPDAIALIEGLALQKPRRSMAALHRQVVTIAEKQGWKPPSYDRVRQIIKNIDPARVTLAHEGAAVYREEFDLLYRREATHSNAIWQADHTPLDILLLDEEGKPARPWLTVIEDDYSRAIAGYRLSFQDATALTTALTVDECLEREPSRIDGDAPEHGAVLCMQGIGAVIHDPVLHQWNSVVYERHGDTPGIGRRTPTERPIPGIERAGIPTIARGTDIDDAIGHPRGPELQICRRVMTPAETIIQFLGRLQLLTPVHRPVAGIDCVQAVCVGDVEHLVLSSHLNNVIVWVDPDPAGTEVKRLALVRRSTNSHDRKTWQILTAVQSHIIR